MHTGGYALAVCASSYASRNGTGPMKKGVSEEQIIIDGIVRGIHGARRAPGVDRLIVPGEMEAEFTATRHCTRADKLRGCA